MPLKVIGDPSGFEIVSVKSTLPPVATLLALADLLSDGARPQALIATPTSAVCVPVTLGLPHQSSAAEGEIGGECGGTAA
jgi:hypothetical protein